MKTKTNLLPAHYEKVSEPSFQGRGNHSVKQLEDICEQYKELTHQLRVEKQALTEISDDLLINLSYMLNTFNRTDLKEGSIGNSVCKDALDAIRNATK